MVGEGSGEGGQASGAGSEGAPSVDVPDVGAESSAPVHEEIFETEGQDRGRVKDIEVAERMANVENTGRSMDRVAKGEALAEDVAVEEIRERAKQEGLVEAAKNEGDVVDFANKSESVQDAAELEYRKFQSEVDKEQIVKLREQLGLERKAVEIFEVEQVAEQILSALKGLDISRKNRRIASSNLERERYFGQDNEELENSDNMEAADLELSESSITLEDALKRLVEMVQELEKLVEEIEELAEQLEEILQNIEELDDEFVEVEKELIYLQSDKSGRVEKRKIKRVSARFEELGSDIEKAEEKRDEIVKHIDEIVKKFRNQIDQTPQ